MAKKKSFFTKDQRDEILDIFVQCFQQVIIPVLSDMSDDIKGLKSGFDRLDEKIDKIDRKLFQITDHQGEKLDNHEKRISTLESKATPN